jgi:hypothetical protein
MSQRELAARTFSGPICSASTRAAAIPPTSALSSGSPRLLASPSIRSCRSSPFRRVSIAISTSFSAASGSSRSSPEPSSPRCWPTSLPSLGRAPHLHGLWSLESFMHLDAEAFEALLSALPGSPLRHLLTCARCRRRVNAILFDLSLPEDDDRPFVAAAPVLPRPFRKTTRRRLSVRPCSCEPSSLPRPTTAGRPSPQS